MTQEEIDARLAALGGGKMVHTGRGTQYDEKARKAS